MKIKKITLLLFLLMPIAVFSQKIYVWCPEHQNIAQRNNFLKNDSIDVIIFDGRVIPDKSRDLCKSEDISSTIFQSIRNTYPDAVFNLKSSSDYYAPSDSNKITIKIGVSAFHAGFGRDITVGVGSVGGDFSYMLIPKGQWNGIVAMYVQISDNRKTSSKFQKEIGFVESRPNLGGYITAKKCLNEAYKNTIQSLLFFIDKSLMN